MPVARWRGDVSNSWPKSRRQEESHTHDIAAARALGETPLWPGEFQQDEAETRESVRKTTIWRKARAKEKESATETQLCERERCVLATLGEMHRSKLLYNQH